jgi:hypothetical protein
MSANVNILKMKKIHWADASSYFQSMRQPSNVAFVPKISPADALYKIEFARCVKTRQKIRLLRLLARDKC